MLAEALLDGEVEALVRKAVQLAKGGDTTALRLCLERLLPPRRSRPVAFNFPKTDSAENVLAAYDAVLRATAKAEITPDEAASLTTLLDGKRKAIETADLAREVEAMRAEADLIKRHLRLAR